MILPLHHVLQTELARTLRTLYGLREDEVPAIGIEVPPSRAFGDLALPVAFELARRLRKAPRAIAAELAAALPALPGAARIVAAPNGYVNVFLDRAAFIRTRVEDGGRAVSPAFTIPTEKTIVEHTAINPNKAAHVGHLRNAALGDTLVRLLRFCGVPVEVQNYIDNTGVQVADVVVGFQHLEQQGPDEVRALADSTRFDYYCWDLYARVTEWYEADPSRFEHRAHALHAIEQGDNPLADLGALVADRIVRCHLRTMGRIGIDYDLLTWEGDILRLHFWARAFEILKADGAVYLQREGRLAGCWVMKIEGDVESTPGSGAGNPSPADGEDESDDDREKVIVRSNGTVTYVGKDIAYQFWKFGVLGRDFYYRPFATRLDGGTLWSTSADPASSDPKAPVFGRAARTYNVIDTRQSYLQKLLKQALATMGHTREAERSTHFAYEMVALSHKTARELGYDPAESADKPFVEVSGRKGLGVKADDLLDRLVAKAAAEVDKRNPGQSPRERLRVAEEIAVAAVRYFLLKFSRGKVIVFDIDEALSFEGESGPYLQYAVVRANNIFNKLRERDGLDEAAVLAAVQNVPADELSGADGDELWGLVLEAARLDEVVEVAIRTLEPSVLGKFAFGLAQQFNAFYHRFPILNEERSDARLWRAAAVVYFRRQLTQALDLMGATVPERM